MEREGESANRRGVHLLRSEKKTRMQRGCVSSSIFLYISIKNVTVNNYVVNKPSLKDVRISGERNAFPRSIDTTISDAVSRTVDSI